MKLLTTTLAAVIGFGLCAAPLAMAAADPFVGKWKFNPEKSQVTGLIWKISEAGDGKLQFTFGEDVETVGLDGTETMTKYGNAWSIKETGPNTWQSTTKRDGKVISTATWTISDDGKMFTSKSKGTRPDGSTSEGGFELKRTAGTSGLVGTWEATGMETKTPNVIQIEKWEDGYAIENPAFKGRTEFKFDGKEYAEKGPRVAEGSTVSAKRINDRTIEVTSKLKGKTVATDRYEVSEDGKTLTDTITFPGVDKPQVDVYERQ